MDRERAVKISKYLSKHLRHQPERLGIKLAPGGWVAVDEGSMSPLQDEPKSFRIEAFTCCNCH